LDPYLAEIAQNILPTYFKHLMMEVEVNPTPKAEAKSIRLELSLVFLCQKIRAVCYNINTFNLAVHSTLIASLVSYTPKQKEDLNRDLMATYWTIPCSALKAELCLMDKERRLQAWMPAQILKYALEKYNDIRTNKEWAMDLKKEEPTNPMLMVAGQWKEKSTKPNFNKKLTKTYKSKGDDSKTKSWRYVPPKDGKPNEKFVENKVTGKKEKIMWCGHTKCNC
jgi:hypothetical protein